MTATMVPPAPSSVTLRDYQEDALTRSAAAEARGVMRQLIVAATGLGKTVMFCELARRRAVRTLIVAHRDELVVQAAAKLLEIMPDLGASLNVLRALRASGEPHLVALADRTRRNEAGVGIVKAAANDVGAMIVVASVQTLSSPARLGQLATEWGTDDDHAGLLADTRTPVGLVIVDEAHHSAADSYGMVLDWFGCGQPDGPLLVGVTATPDRGDGKGLDDLFDEIVATYDILFGIDRGYLSDLRGVEVRLANFDESKLKTSRGDYQAGQSGQMLSDAGAPAEVVKAWLREAKGRRTLGFTPTVALAQEFADEFNRHGIAAGWVAGTTTPEDRRAGLAKFRSGELTVMMNCAVLTEGYDNPRVDCILVARPTKSRALYVQMIGRGTRKHPEKTDCLVLDVVGATSHHSLLTIPSLFGLENPKARDGSAPISGLIREHEEQQIAAGLLAAREVELFRPVTDSKIAWARITHPVSKRPNYMVKLGNRMDGDTKVELPTVVIAQASDDDNDWNVGLLYPDGTKRALMMHTSLEMAQGTGEDFARKHAANTRFISKDQAWRSGKPTPGQLAAAAKWHVKVGPDWTAGQVSEAIDAKAAAATAHKLLKRKK